MPQTISDETFQALRGIVKELDFRAKRLLEWRTLLLKTEVSESRFDVFLVQYKGADDPPTAEQLVDLKRAWEDCASQLLELRLLPESFLSITQSLKDPSSEDPTLKAWITDVVTAGECVGNDLAKSSFGDLKNHIAEYKAAYTKLSIQRDAKVQMEVNMLAAVTNRLKLEFELS